MSHAFHRYTYGTFLDAAKAAPRRTYPRDWTGGLDNTQTLRYAERGQDSNVPAAKAILEKLQGTVDTPRRMWQRSVYGAVCDTPEFLIGIPDCMRYRRPVKDASNPITIYASIMASAAVSADAMMRRGIAILALVLKLQAIRPISLYALCPWVNTTLVIEIPTKPLSIAHAAFCLSHPAYFRRLGHDVLFTTGDYNTCMADDSSAAKRISMRPQDLYVGTGVSSLNWDGQTMSKYASVLSDPVGWINETIKRYARP